MTIAVINVTLPDEPAQYVHRIGRVGRAERFVHVFLKKVCISRIYEKSHSEPANATSFYLFLYIFLGSIEYEHEQY